MERTRIELLDGVWLTAVRDRDRENACLRVALLSQLERERAAMNRKSHEKRYSTYYNKRY